MDKFHKNKHKFSSIKPLILISNEVLELRREQIKMFTSELLKYKVLLRDLIKENVSYSIRNELLNIAMFINSNTKLYDEFIKQEDIPVNAVCMATRVNSKFIKRYREYLIAYILILGDQKYKNLQDYIQIVETTDEDLGKDIVEYEGKLGIEGIVLEDRKKSVIVMTSIGEFKKLKLKDRCVKGVEVRAVEKKSLRDYKFYLAIISIFTLILTSAIIYKYNNVVSTVVIETTSAIKLEINEFNRVLNITSATEKGKILISETSVLDNNIDKAICKIIEYANENEMVKSSGIVITITGKSLKHNSLSETSDLIYKKDLKVRFNNAGSEHKLN